MDLTSFYRDDRTREHLVTIKVAATVFETVQADSPEEARRIVEARLENNEIDVYGSDFEEAEIERCVKSKPMFCIKRPNSNVTGTTHPQVGDEPRMPTEFERDAYKPEAV